jgi:peptidyl-prolyl cis-trans isomerase SurA
MIDVETTESSVRKITTLVFVSVLLFLAAGSRAEVIEEIVAKVNDDIITKSDLEGEEQATLAELYRRYTGDELDRQVRAARSYLLQRMIDRKILFHRAQRLYDMDKMSESFLKEFKAQQQIKSDQELERLLAQENMTLADLRVRLVESFAPDQVVRYEVSDRVSVGDKEIEAYYEANAAEFDVPAEVTIREIVVLATPEDRDEKRARAEAIRDRATAAGADFSAIAAETSDAGTKSGGGLLGPLKKGDLAEQIETVAFSLPVGNVSQVLEASYGFHIVKIESRNEQRRKPLTEVHDAIRAKLENEKYREGLRAFLKKAREEATVEVSAAYKSRLNVEEDEEATP